MKRLFIIKNKIYTYFLLGLVSISLFLQSCGGGGSNKAVAPTVKIPSDASLVVCLNLKSMTAKAPKWKNSIGSDFFENLGEDAEMLSAILETGIDMNSTACLFGKLDKNRSKNYSALAFALKDANKFEASLKKNNDDIKIKERKGKKYASFNGDAVIMWDSNKALVVVSPDMGGEDNLLKMADKINDNTTSLESKNTEYKKLISKSYDIAFWVNAQDITEASNDEFTSYQLEQMGMDKVYNKLNGMTDYVTGVVNFEKGKVVSDMESILNKNKLAIYKKLFDKKGINKNLASKMPLKKPMMLMSFAINMNEIYNLFGDKMKEGDEDMVKELGINSQQLMTMLSGELVMGLDEISVSNLSGVETVLGIGIKNKKSLNKILEKLESKNIIKKKGNMYERKIESEFPVELDFPLYIIPKNDMLFIVTNDRMKNDVKAGKSILSSDLSSSLNKNTSFVLIDFKAMAKRNPLLTGVSFFEEVESISAENKTAEGNIIKSKAEMILTNKKDNSLSVIIQLIKDSVEEVGGGGFI